MKSETKRILFLILFALLMGLGIALASPTQEEPGEISAIFPDQEEFRQIIIAGLSARHDEALKLAAAYTEKHKDHPCGYFVQGLAHEWMIEPMIPKPYLGPAIEGFEQAGRRKAYTQAELHDTAAGICRGAALIRLSRIYYKYGQYMTAVHRAIAGGKELERVSAMSPNAYDLYTFLGPYHYISDRAPAPVKMLFRVFGLKGDREKGLRELELAWEKAPLFRDEAGQVLFVLLTKYEQKPDKHSEEIVDALVERYPQNLIFRRLKTASQAQVASSRLDSRP